MVATTRKTRIRPNPGLFKRDRFRRVAGFVPGLWVARGSVQLLTSSVLSVLVDTRDPVLCCAFIGDPWPALRSASIHRWQLERCCRLRISPSVWCEAFFSTRFLMMCNDTALTALVAELTGCFDHPPTRMQYRATANDQRHAHVSHLLAALP